MRSEIVALESHIIKKHKIPAIRLMRRASEGAFKLLCREYPNARRITVFCGSGNNGGDGWVLAALACRAGFKVSVVALAEPVSLSGEAAEAWRFAHQELLSWQGVDDLSLPEQASEATDLIVDAMLGTGLKRAVRGDYSKAIDWINRAQVPVLALDIPSGLNADTGRVMGEQAVRADLTISFVGQKRGLLTGLGRYYSGRCYCDDLDTAEYVRAFATPQCTVLRPKPITARSPVAYKTNAGRVLVVGGNKGTVGAAVLAATAALRVGAGLVTLAMPEASSVDFIGMRPELMVRQTRSVPELDNLLQGVDVVVAGPGFGQDAWAQAMLYGISRTALPLVLDAEALRVLAKQPKTRLHSCYPVLTPHPGEAGDLLSMTATEVETDRFLAARTLHEQYQATIVLKGAGTILCAHAQHFELCTKGNAGMASAGMGDVLSGVLGGLLAQEDIYSDSKNAYEARVGLGVYLHSWAADRTANIYGQRGILAGDLYTHFPRLLKRMQVKHSI